MYAGLFLSPFLVVFAVSVFFMVHSWIPGAKRPPVFRTATDAIFPGNLEASKGKEQIAAIRSVLETIDVRGEIGFVRYISRDRRFVVPVMQPGRLTTVELNMAAQTVTIASSRTGIADAMVYLHKMPGPHNVNIRGNSGHVRLWRWLADVTVYLLLLVSVSGVYLWAVLKTQRRIGLGLLGAGALTFSALIYVLVG